MPRFNATDLTLNGLKLVERQQLNDKRGFFSRLFCAEELAEIGWRKPIAQINHSYTSRRGTVRGMHFQYPPHAEMKLVSCLKGEIWDVAVDLRSGSPTFLCWVGECLSAENRRALLIPEGFAHGFQSVTDEVELLYCHSALYRADAQGGLNPKDRDLNIPWPLPVSEMSDTDLLRPFINTGFEGVVI